MGHVDQRAGGLGHLETLISDAAQGSLRRAMRSNHYRPRFHRADPLLDSNPFGIQLGQDRLVMDEVTQHREWLRLRLFQCQGDRVANAETHPQMFCLKNLHILCATKCLTTRLFVCSKLNIIYPWFVGRCFPAH